MRYRIFTRTAKRKIMGLAPSQIWASVGLSVALIGVIVGMVTLWPSRPSQASTNLYQRSRGIEKYADIITGYHKNWVNLPGSTAETGGVRISPTPFTIVEQDGTGGQPNPPVNLYGAHLKIGGDFKISSKLKEVTSKATLSLYGQVPIIYDEFRYERSTLQLTFDGNQLKTQVWENNKAGEVKAFAIDDATQTKDLQITRQDGLITFTINGTRVGDIPEGKLFKSGEVWFGATAESSPWLLASLRAERLNSADLQVIDTSSIMVRPSQLKGEQGLQQLTAARRSDFTIGAAVALAPLVSDPDYSRTALGGNFGSFTTENALKWQFVHPTEATYEFREADAIFDVAQHHGIKIHGHTLVFGEANPKWVNDLPVSTPEGKQKIEKVMLDHIATVAGRYKGKAATWDVINEPIADYDEFEAGEGPLRNHIWYRAMGEAYIAKAFQAARAADPNAKLFMNEFGLEDDGDRWDEFFALVKRLKEQGVPIDGVGFQAHVYERADKISASTLRSHIQALAKIGVQSRISEMDVYIEDGQSVQAQQFSAVLQACLQEPSCISFTTWGVSDRYDMFRDDDGSLQFGEDFLWDTNMRPTPAVEAMRRILQ